MKFLLKIVTICAILLNLTACSSMKTLDAPIPIKIENQTIVVGETQMKALYSCSYLSHLDFEQPLIQDSYYTGIKLYNKKRKVIGELGLYVEKDEPLKEAVIASIRLYPIDAEITYHDVNITQLTYAQAKQLFPDAIYDQYSIYMQTGAYALHLQFKDNQTLQTFQHKKEYPVDWHHNEDEN